MTVEIANDVKEGDTFTAGIPDTPHLGKAVSTEELENFDKAMGIDQGTCLSGQDCAGSSCTMQIGDVLMCCPSCIISITNNVCNCGY